MERQSYRRRRLIEAARLLPVLGIILFAVPLMWPSTSAVGGEGFALRAVSMSSAIFYIFAVWVLLIVLSLLFGRQARHWGDTGGAESEAGSPE